MIRTKSMVIFMKLTVKKSLSFIFALLFISQLTAFSVSAEPEADEIKTFVGNEPVTSEAAIIIDFATGVVVYEHNADELRVPASMTKMIAAYVVFDAIDNGIVDFDTEIAVSSPATSAFSYNRAFTNVPMPLGSVYTVRELLNVVIVNSAGAATIALGEGIFGSEEALIQKMNEKLQELDIAGEFFDSWGGSPQNRISSRGMAKLTRAFIKDYPDILELTSQRIVSFENRNYRSTNPLLTSYEGVDGFKTGYTRPAGWCFTGTAEIDGRRIITVTMGSVQGYRFPDTVILLDFGFTYYNISIANHFRSSVLYSLEALNTPGTPLVPIKMYNIDEAKYMNILDLALILNETERKD